MDCQQELLVQHSPSAAVAAAVILSSTNDDERIHAHGWSLSSLEAQAKRMRNAEKILSNSKCYLNLFI